MWYRLQRRENRAAQKGWSTWYGERQAPPIPAQQCIGGSKGTRQGNMQYSLSKVPGCGDTLKAQHLGWGSQDDWVTAKTVNVDIRGPLSRLPKGVAMDAPGCASKPDGESREEPEEHKRSIGLHPSKNGRCSQIIKSPKIGVSRHLDSSTTSQMAKIMVQYGRPSRSS